MATRKPTLLAMFVGILCLTFVAYLSVIHAGYVWDDDSWLTGNPAVLDPHGLRAIWTSVPRMQYYPLLFTTFWLEHRLFGLEPLGYHLVNVLLHACNAFLVGLILRSLRLPGAFWVAAVFAVHPVHVESVAWVTELKNVQSGFFCLASALAYLEFERRRTRGVYALALALFACALLSKTATATLPAALAVIAAWRRWPPRARDLLPLAPFVILAVALSSVTVSLESELVAGVNADFQLTAWQRALVAARALLFYPYKLLIPYPLIFNYPRFDVSGSSPAALGPLVMVALIAFGLAILWRRGWRGPGAAVLVYAVTLVPALGFFDVYAFRFSFVADHFQYLASIGILALLPEAGEWLPNDRVRKALGAGVLVVLSALTWNQSRAYRDEATLWRDTIAKNPDSWIAHHNLANLLSTAGDLDGAAAGFDQAIRCKPSSAESYNGRGLVRLKQQRIDLALGDLNRAIELDSTFPEAYLNRGQALAAAKRLDEAIADFDQFLESNPSYGPAYQDRAMAKEELGDHAGALADLTQAIGLDASSAELYGQRGFIEVRMGRYDAAQSDFDTAIRLKPTLALTYVLRGGLYERLDGDTRRACGEWQQACRLGSCRMFEANCAGR